MFTASLPGIVAVCEEVGIRTLKRQCLVMGPWVLREAALRRDSSLLLLEISELCKDWVVQEQAHPQNC